MELVDVLPPAQTYIVVAACVAAIGTVVNNITKNRTAGNSPLDNRADLVFVLALAVTGVLATLQLLWLTFEKGLSPDCPLPVSTAFHLSYHGLIVFVVAMSFFGWSGRKASSDWHAPPTLHHPEPQ